MNELLHFTENKTLIVKHNLSYKWKDLSLRIDIC